MIQEFDAPVFKILAHNDTGEAVGHQGGVVIPKDLDPFFPQLARSVSAHRPTVDQRITAHMFDGSVYLGSAETRYQFQTWGGTRSPERRLTGNITPLRNRASAGDVLLIQRGVIDDAQYRLTLLRIGSPDFEHFAPLLGGRRWGVLDLVNRPATELEVEDSLSEIVAREHQPFDMFDSDATVVETRSRRVSRSRAFQTRVVQLYGQECAICGSGLCHPSGKCELEAAHIVPRTLKGSDDARNGLLLCRSHHWAFDAGIVGVNANYQVVVPEAVLAIPANQLLLHLHNRAIKLPNDPLMLPSLDAFDWHTRNIMVQ